VARGDERIPWDRRAKDCIKEVLGTPSRERNRKLASARCERGKEIAKQVGRNQPAPFAQERKDSLPPLKGGRIRWIRENRLRKKTSGREERESCAKRGREGERLFESREDPS